MGDGASRGALGDHTSLASVRRSLPLAPCRLLSYLRLGCALAGHGDNPVAAEYNLGMTAADFVRFLNEQAGTHRVAGGGLAPEYGRHAELDAMAGG